MSNADLLGESLADQTDFSRKYGFLAAESALMFRQPAGCGPQRTLGAAIGSVSGGRESGGQSELLRVPGLGPQSVRRIRMPGNGGSTQMEYGCGEGDAWRLG